MERKKKHFFPTLIYFSVDMDMLYPLLPPQKRTCYGNPLAEVDSKIALCFTMNCKRCITSELGDNY